MAQWHFENVLMPQIEKLPYKLKCYLWYELMQGVEFKDAYESIIQYNLRHREELEQLKQETNKKVMETMLAEYPETREDLIIRNKSVNK